MEELIKQWSTGKVKTLGGPISVNKEHDARQIEICDLGETVLNKKQQIVHSLKDDEKCASAMQSVADNTQEGKTRLLYKVKIMQTGSSDITCEISNKVTSNARAEE